jgi:hypothetical protein
MDTSNKNIHNKRIFKYIGYYLIAYFFVQLVFPFLYSLISNINTPQGLLGGDGIILIIIGLTSLPVSFLMILFFTPILSLVSGIMALKFLKTTRIFALITFSIDLISRILLLQTYLDSNTYYFHSIVEKFYIYGLIFNFLFILIDISIVLFFLVDRTNSTDEIKRNY